MSGAINPGFATASVIALITFGVHTFVGGIYVARPLLKARDLTPASRWLNYYTWHMVTALLLFMSAGFAMAATSREAADVGFLLTTMALVFALLCINVALRGGIKPWRLPATSLFLVMTIAGFWGLDGYGLGPTIMVKVVPAA